MSYLDKLLQGVPVEWKTLGEVCDVINGSRKPVKASLRIAGNTPYYGANNIQDYVDGYTHDGEFILIAEDGSASIENYSIQWVNGKFWANNHVHVVTGKELLLNRFLYHYLKVMNFVPYLTGGGRAKLTKGQLVLIPIPIPPLSVQEEIVRILDKFTALEAELDCRKRQYEYYRDYLLTVNEQGLMNNQKVEWKTLGDIGEVKMCKRILKSETRLEGDIPFYKIGTFGKEANAYISREIYELYRKRYPFPKKGDILISASGTIGRTVVYDGEPAYFEDSNIVWIDNDESIVSNRYLWHFYKVAKWFVSGGGTIDRLYNDNIRKTKIPVPPIEEQERIVAILDKFDTLAHSISEGLPKEIELRKKQYEYYRDQLLSFNG
ncbi:restriction endonuclease subunit S [Riemerella anatipestifer]|uniref:restriction endonuclease subunit S n=1 Tax=Riemerella anatipestifer TaxID=34085 RepID=UPI000D68D2A1|nr:restriction endonuclease subunit S [Riemerella anatipestifer]MRM84679.1 restriction endonuclease subunit S [Riemerella anatipestifer]WPC10646.1 restriction endonuclease subunit S [Riemerella anatipestifer]WPC13713.1 restriction endonuclease subunit S [Riemerella anatipestifer]WPC14526.1 restriction endonuclease subunit S [Riemerella anatipestifer]